MSTNALSNNTAQTYAAPVAKKTLKVTRELDGLNSTGVIGEQLRLGTTDFSKIEALFADSKFKVSSLLGEDNKVSSSNATLFGDKALCADDMYIAGDPGVGGKGNNYQYKDVSVATGFITMLEDGADNGRKVTINSKVDTINPQKAKAFTEYGFVIQDDAKAKTKATLSGGKLVITDPQGKQTTLLPGQEYVIGDSKDPVAKFYYADVPGGKDGKMEKRLVFDHFEKPTTAVVDKMVAEGVDRKEAEALRTKNTATFGFRVPDGGDTYRMSQGVGSGNALTSSKGIKTYYDAHFGEGDCKTLDIKDTPPNPNPNPNPTPTPTPNPDYNFETFLHHFFNQILTLLFAWIK